jgi:aspartate carbamoyltransferase catalytic subunit
VPDHQRRRRHATSIPTQALLDLLTIRERRVGIAGLTVAIVGDSAAQPGRRARTCTRCAARRHGAPRRPADALPREFASLGASIPPALADGVRDADVVMMLRIQRERQGANFFPSVDEYSQLLLPDGRDVRQANPDVIILHPGPINRGSRSRAPSPTDRTRSS